MGRTPPPHAAAGYSAPEMASPTSPLTLLSLPTPVSAFAFNADRTQLAVCPNNELVQIYALDGASGAWSLAHTLAKHTALVTGIDWAPKSNRLVTCSQDRNGYVWTPSSDGSAWTPELVMLRINRSATCVAWSPNEDKFAVGSGSALVSVCYYDKDNEWWSSKHLKKPIYSTVLSVDWHPNNVLLAVACADGCARVFSAFIKGLDAKPAPSAWGERLPFGTVCADVATDAGSWVHGVKFSPSGEALAFVAHDSSFNVFYPGANVRVTVRTPLLPLLSLAWLDEQSCIGVGHDCTPVLFSGSAQGWRYAGKVDEGKKGGAGAAAGAGPAALAKFRAMDTRAISTPQQNDSDPSTVHQNSITTIRLLGDAAATYATAGIDGRVVVWNSLDEGFKRLAVA